MSIQNRPNAVTVIAVINFIFGGMGLLSLLCLGCMGGFVSWVASRPMPDGSANPVQSMIESFSELPGFVPYVILSVGLGSIMSALLFVSGFGLLKLRNWARMACFVYAICTFLSTVGGTYYSTVYVNPAITQSMAKQQEELAKKTPGSPPPPAQSPLGGAIGSVAGGVFGLVYPIALLIILNLAHVREAFRTGGAVPVDREAAQGWGDVPDQYRGERGRLMSDDDRIQGSDR